MQELVSLSVVAYGQRDDKMFDYTLPEGANLQIGSVVKVQFGKQKSLAIVRTISPKISGSEKVSNRKLIEISSVMPIHPLPVYMVELATWIMEYYACSPRAAWRTILPSGLEQKSRLTSPMQPTDTNAPPQINLNEEQLAAVKKITAKKYRGYLLHGITGSRA